MVIGRDCTVLGGMTGKEDLVHDYPANGPQNTTVAALDPLCTSRSHPTTITAWYWRSVKRSMDIDGRLPNALFTLLPGTIHTILCTSGMQHPAGFLLCRKFYSVLMAAAADQQTVTADGTTMTLFAGRLVASGANPSGCCGVGSITPFVAPSRVTLPPVSGIWGGAERWFADTTRGFFAWGDNRSGALGIDDNECQPAWTPVLVGAPGEWVDVQPSVDRTFFLRVDGTWAAAGDNSSGQLGLGPTLPYVPHPASTPNSAGIMRWIWGAGRSIGVGEGLVMAAGSNADGTIDPAGPPIIPWLTDASKGHRAIGDRARETGENTHPATVPTQARCCLTRICKKVRSFFHLD